MNGTVGAFGETGKVDTICISLFRDVGPTAKKLYLSVHSYLFFLVIELKIRLIYVYVLIEITYIVSVAILV